MQYTAVKGMHDLLPPESSAWAGVEATIRDVCARYGYSEIRTPVVEKLPLFVRSVGESTAIVEKEMYSFVDQGDEHLALRPEGTAPVVRAYVESGLFQTDPVAKFYYFGPMFRRERPQKGRYRQFHQFGVECIGAAGPLSDVEVIALLMRLLGSLGLGGLQLDLNSLGCANCRPAYLKVLQRLLANIHGELCPECQRRMEKNPLRVFDCKNESCRHAIEDAPAINEYWCGDCSNHFREVCEGLDSLKLGYELNHRIARGLDYYVRTAFEVTSPGLGSQNAVGGGGRYDGLVKALGGPDIPGVGFAVGMERLMLLLKEAHAPKARPPIFVAAIGMSARAHVLPLIEEMRTGGLVVEWDYEGRSLKGQMRRADRLGSHTVVIIGDDELKAGVATIRNMQTKEQHAVALNDVAQTLKHPNTQTHKHPNTLIP